MSDSQHFKQTSSYLTNFVMQQNRHFKVQYKKNLQGDRFSDSILARTWSWPYTFI